MTARFLTLASGSAGNSSLLEVEGFGLLIDCGLDPRLLGSRLSAVGASWDDVHAVVLTHTHGDHWKNLTLAHLRTRNVPVYAHPAQHDRLSVSAAAYDSLHRAKLTRPYHAGEPITFAPGLVCHPLEVSHDAEPTFAFRLEHHDGHGGAAWAVGYASDLGCFDDTLVDAFAGVDMLAVEYNHDVRMQRTSSRPAFLIDRVLGERGHLSNAQAADLTARVMARSGPGTMTHLVQLHLSRQCNTPALAATAGRGVYAAAGRAGLVVTATQDSPSRIVPLARRPRPGGRVVIPATELPPLERRVAQPTLPGFDV